MEEDYLTVDMDIPGQNYCCLSFVEPSNMDLIADKESFICSRFLENYINNYNNKRKYHEDGENKVAEDEENKVAEDEENKVAEDGEEKVLEDGSRSEQAEENTLSVLEKLKVKHTEELSDLLNYDNIKKCYEDFKIVNFNKLSKEFEKKSPKNKEVTVRGIKVRGSFSTLSRAQDHADNLQKEDRLHHVFVGQVGYWLPFNPIDIDSIKKQEYLNNELNNLVREKTEQAEKRDMIFNDRKAKLSKKM